jgi:hypothetical protein
MNGRRAVDGTAWLRVLESGGTFARFAEAAAFAGGAAFKSPGKAGGDSCDAD